MSIIGPRTVQHGSDYTLFLSSIDYSKDEKVEISIVGQKLNEEIETKTFKLGHLGENVTFAVSFRSFFLQPYSFFFQKLSDFLTIQNYTLTAKIPSENFEQSVDIFTISKRYSVFIQTDKPKYKPGDKIQFRVLIIDSEMKPYRVDKLKIELIDSFNNAVAAIEEDEEEKLEIGVISEEFQIASEPVTGLWGIRVTSLIKEEDENEREEVVTDQKFEIKEYVLPRFEVFVDTNHDVTLDAGSIRLTVYAKYPSGEFVKGKATITAQTFDVKIPSYPFHTTVKSVNIEFKRMVEFNIRDELKIANQIRPQEVELDVVFEELLTGQKLGVSIKIYIFLE